MRSLQDLLTWSVAILMLTGLIPACAAVILARARNWALEYAQSVARWIAVVLSVSWWAIAVYGLNMQFPYDWIGRTVGTPVRVMAFTAWCLAPGLLAPFLTAKVYGPCIRRISKAD
jgi:hypothetical protein